MTADEHVAAAMRHLEDARDYPASSGYALNPATVRVINDSLTALATATGRAVI